MDMDHDDVASEECVGVESVEAALVRVGASRVQRRAAVADVAAAVRRMSAQTGGVPSDARFLVQRCRCCGVLSVDVCLFGGARSPRVCH